MRRLIALLGKELRQHAAAGMALGVVLAMSYGLMLVGSVFNPEIVSLMQAHAAFLGLFVNLTAIVLGSRLVVAEYFGRTQLFVESLPLRRWEMLAVKYGLGLATLLLISGASLVVSLLAALTREAISPRFLAIIGTRTVVWLFFIWSFFFVMGLVGKLRVPIYIGILLALTVLDQMTAFEFQNFAPIVVLDTNTMAVERELMPTAALVETLAYGLVFVIVAFVLALINEGSVAETLARRMSQREKAMVAILFIALLFALTALEERRDKDPYAFVQDEVLRSENVPVEVLYLEPRRRGDAHLLLDSLEGDLAALRDTLGWPRLPEIRVAYWPSLDPEIYDRAVLNASDGILVRANFRPDEGFTPRAFRAFLIGEVLDEATRDRARFEPKAWLRDGFAHWWTLDAGMLSANGVSVSNAAERACTGEFPALLRALWLSRTASPGAAEIRFWRRYRERHGEAMAEAMALAGLLALEEERGREAVLALARHVFARRPPEDAREFVYEFLHPMPKVFEQATALAWTDFLGTWNAALERWRTNAACTHALGTIPAGASEIEVVHEGGTVRDLVYRFDFEVPPDDGSLVTLLHTRLGPFDDELERRDLRRVEHLWKAGGPASWRLPGQYGQGSRVFLGLEVDVPAFGCAIRLLAERREIP